MSWTAKDYEPELELSIKADITGDLVSANDSSINPWYSKNCRYNKEVYIDTTNFILGVRGYGEKPFTIQRGHYNVFDLVTMIVDVINEIYVAASLGLYLVYVNEDHGGRVRMGCRNGSKPRFIMICDNPFFEFISGPYAEPVGVYLFCYFEFHRDWHIRIPELKTPSKFLSAVYEGLVWLEQSWKSLIVGTRTRIAK